MELRYGSVANAAIIACGVTLVLVLGACASSPAPPPRATVTFDYVPRGEAVPGAAEVTFAVVGSHFDSPVPMFSTFARNMSKDFHEMLTARGFTTRGPFRYYDEMTFPDKKGSDLVLHAEVEFVPDLSGVAIREAGGFGKQVLAASFGGTTGYQWEGPLVVSGHVNLVLSESLTNERMWQKSVSITPIRVEIRTDNAYYASTVTLETLLRNENTLYSDLGRALEHQYEEILNRSYGYLDPEEMRLVKQQAMEIRQRKVFQ